MIELRSTFALEAMEKGNIGIEADMLAISEFTVTSFLQQVETRIAVVLVPFFVWIKS